MSDKEVYEEVKKVLKAIEMPHLIAEEALAPSLEEDYRLPGGQIIKNVYQLAFFIPSKMFPNILAFAYVDRDSMKVLFVTTPQYLVAPLLVL